MHFGRFFGSVAVAIALIFITSFLSTQQNIFFSTKPLDLRKLSPINVSQDRRSYSWKAEPNIAATATQHNSTKRDSLRSVTALRSEHKPSSPGAHLLKNASYVAVCLAVNGAWTDRFNALIFRCVQQFATIDKLRRIPRK